MKVKELVKELGVTKEEVLDQLRNLFVEAEDENSEVDEKIAGLVRIKLCGSAVKKKPAKKVKKKAVRKKVSEQTAAAKKNEPGEKQKTGKKAAPGTKNEKKEKDITKKTEKEDKAEKEKPGKKSKAPKTGIKSKKNIEIVSRAEPKAEEKLEKKGSELEKEKRSEGKSKEAVFLDASELAKKTKDKAEPVKKAKTKKQKTKYTKVSYKDIEVIEKGEVYRPRPRKKGKGTAKNKPFSSIEEVVVGKSSTAARKTPQKIELKLPLTARELAPRINVKPNAIIQYLMSKGAAVNINQNLDEDIIRDILSSFGYELQLPKTIESMEQELVDEHRDTKDAAIESRAPVVTFMGHVDHGKTSLLDFIRDTMVTKSEKGGITQHIGAYKVETEKASVTFLDTPGHAAFTSMRARGANVTDVVVLVVAADDGVMPQTKEAIDHARAAGVPIVVAINKCDLPGANPDKVKTELQQEGLMPEEWGGANIMVEVSAATGEGIDNLVEMLMLESEMLELKSNSKLKARGVVVESKKTPGQGVVTTLLIQNGTLHSGDVVLCGQYYGRVKAMLNDKGKRIQDALPSTPVEILGLQGLPESGEEFFVVKDEKKAKILSGLKQNEGRRKRIAGDQRISLEDLYSRIMEGSMKELKIILKTDVQGSVEAMRQSLADLSNKEVKVNIIHSGVGNVNESDAMLALVSNAVVIGFHVKVEPKAEEIAKREKLDIHLYDVIYEAIADVKAGMEGLLEPELKQIVQGVAQVIEIFPSKNGKAAGCKVTKGIIHRKDKVRVIRGKETVFDGDISALKRFKDDVKEVKEGFECGISINNFNMINRNDLIEAYIIEKIARRLS
jgi:translation initiation factor IF-2